MQFVDTDRKISYVQYSQCNSQCKDDDHEHDDDDNIFTVFPELLYMPNAKLQIQQLKNANDFLTPMLPIQKQNTQIPLLQSCKDFPACVMYKFVFSFVSSLHCLWVLVPFGNMACNMRVFMNIWAGASPTNHPKLPFHYKQAVGYGSQHWYS